MMAGCVVLGYALPMSSKQRYDLCLLRIVELSEAPWPLILLLAFFCLFCLRSAGTKSIGKWAHVERVYKDLCNKEEYAQFQRKMYLEE